MARVLVVDDDQALLAILSDYLTRFDHQVMTAPDGASGLRAIEDVSPDIVLLDVTMPGMDGLAALRELRGRSMLPVILLTARAEEPDVLNGFSSGADDYVVKPFSFAQLEARIRAVLARSGTPAQPAPAVLAGGDLRLDLDAQRVRRRGENVKLTPTEFRLLATLMEQPGKIFSPEQLVRKVWGDEYVAESDYVRRYVWYLRRKIESNPEAPRYIRNERNVGYYFATA